MVYDPELITSLEIAIMQQGLEIRELKTRIETLERALRYHANNYETAHKI